MKKHKKTKVKPLFYYYIGASIIAVICIVVVVVKVVQNNTSNSDSEYYDLESCLKFFPETNYEMQISCYKRYGGSDYLDRILDIKQKQAEANGEALSPQESTSNSEPQETQQPETPTYTDNTPTYTPSQPSPTEYTPYEPTEQPTYYQPAPTTPTAPDPTPTLTCDDYRSKYYSEYQTKVLETQTSYNQSISSASMSCSGHGGCPAVTNLKRQLESELATLEAEYANNMASVGCAP